MNNELEILEINKDNLNCYLYTIRGQRVLLDYDLSKAYGYTTSAFNRQIKNNIGKFPDESYMFQLTDDELLRCNFCTAKSISSKRRYNPYAFTEKGLYMLMTVLKGDLAVRQNIALVEAFQALKNYYIETNNLLSNNGIIELVNQVHENKNSIRELQEKTVVIDNELSKVMLNFVDPSTYKHYLFKGGERLEADIAYKEIYSLAKHSIYIIDDYIGVKTLFLLKSVDPAIDIKIFSDDINREGEIVVQDFYKDTGREITISPTHKLFHDRYIIIDYRSDSEHVFHCGGSSKDMGSKVSTIMEIEKPEVYHPVVDTLLA